MRLIDADALMLAFNDWWYSSFGQEENEQSLTIKEAMKAIEYAPTIDRPNVSDCWGCNCPKMERLSADRPQGWVDKAISITDDMQREGIIDYEQAWEFRMRARMKGADDE